MLGNLVKLERVVTEMKLDGFIWDKFLFVLTGQGIFIFVFHFFALMLVSG